MGVRDVVFEGLRAPVRTVNCEDILEGLAGYVPGWSFSVSDRTEAEACAVLAFNGSAWMIQSPHTKAPRVHKSAVNLVCDLLSALASAMLAEEPGLLCFHSAALEVADGLVLFPAVRRSGKSTLSAALMARGTGLFTDDYLPVEQTQEGRLLGRATGIAARLRLPLPDTMPDDARAYIAAHPGPENTQYRYLPGPEVRPRGLRRPIRSIVLLDRQDDTGAHLSPVSEGELLGRLAHQNFSRGRPAGETLTALIALSQAAPATRLTYTDPDEAAELVLGALPAGDDSLSPPVTFPRPGPRPDTARLDADRPYHRTPHAELREAGDIWVGASCDGRKILQFDSSAVGVLDLLSEPMTPNELVALIHETFPGADKDKLRDNTLGILRNFLKAGYIARS